MITPKITQRFSAADDAFSTDLTKSAATVSSATLSPNCIAILSADVAYSAQTHTCCNNVAQLTSGQSGECCGSVAINTDVQGCCHGSAFDLSTQQCCGGECLTSDGHRLHVFLESKGAVIGGDDQCCNDRWRMQADQVCCPNFGPMAAQNGQQDACCEAFGMTTPPVLYDSSQEVRGHTSTFACFSLIV